MESSVRRLYLQAYRRINGLRLRPRVQLTSVYLAKVFSSKCGLQFVGGKIRSIDLRNGGKFRAVAEKGTPILLATTLGLSLMAKAKTNKAKSKGRR